MNARFLSALSLMILLSVAGTAVAKMQPATPGGGETAGNQHSQDQGVPKAVEHGERHKKSDDDSSGDAQGNDNPGSDDQGDDNGQHKDKGHHYGKRGTGNGHHPNAGNKGNGGGSGSSTGSGSGVLTVVALGPPGSGTTGSTGGTVAVPEPATLALLGLGLLGCALRARRR